MITKITTCLFLFFLSYTLTGKAQQHNSSPVSKQISPDLFGIFFEWDSWKKFSTNIENVKGVHDVYFVFKGVEPHMLFNFDYWEFIK